MESVEIASSQRLAARDYQTVAGACTDQSMECRAAQSEREKGNKKESLFLGGMTCATNLSELQQFLRNLTGSNSGLFVSMVNRIKRKSFSGYAIIKNVDPVTAQRLLQIKNFKFQGCWYGIKPFLKKKSDISKLRTERTEKKVYLNGLVESLTENDLEGHFRKYGQVLHVQISKHLGTNRYKGYGFVEFDTTTSAQTALGVHHHTIKGTTVVCQQTNGSKKQPSTNKTTSSSNGVTDNLGQTAKSGSQPKLDCPIGKVNSTSHLSDLLMMCPKIAQNHYQANVAFRVNTKL